MRSRCRLPKPLRRQTSLRRAERNRRAAGPTRMPGTDDVRRTASFRAIPGWQRLAGRHVDGGALRRQLPAVPIGTAVAEFAPAARTAGVHRCRVTLGPAALSTVEPGGNTA